MKGRVWETRQRTSLGVSVTWRRSPPDIKHLRTEKTGNYFTVGEGWFSALFPTQEQGREDDDSKKLPLFSMSLMSLSTKGGTTFSFETRQDRSPPKSSVWKQQKHPCLLQAGQESNTLNNTRQVRVIYTSQKTSNLVRLSVTFACVPPCHFRFSKHIMTSSVIYKWTETGNYN